ncbi:YdgA family protein [Idiomarina abyssalis]|uniref:YdgA family protein n=1 Tax=Idiomarina abyssalis TaxID=86102 RepID=UPI001CD60CE5|nr:YdgA family protein [Idiomarina abyssalis]
MNKKGLLGGVGIVVVAAALIGPRFAGSQVEDTLKQHVEALNNVPAYTAQVVSFDRGWFGSTATVELGVDFSGAFPEAEQSEELSFEVVIDVQHGPVLTQFSPGLGLASLEASSKDEGLREFLDWEDETPFYHMVGSVGFSGTFSYSDSISSFTLVPNDARQQISVSRYEGSGEVSSDSFSYEGVLEGAEVLMEVQAVSVGEMKVRTEAKGDLLSIMQGGLYESEMSMQLEKVTARSPDDVDFFNLEELDVEAISAFSDNEKHMNVDMNYSMKSFMFGDTHLDNLVVNMAFNNLDAEFLRAYNQTMQTIYDQGPDEMEAATEKLVKDSLPQLLKAEPEFVVSEFSGQMEPGNFEGDLSAKLVGVAQVPDNLDDIRFWLSSLIADASLTVDKPLLKWLAEQQLLSTMRMQYPGADEAEMQKMAEQQAPIMINMYLQQGLLTETEDDYRSEFQMEGGEAMLNGQKVPLGNMM